MNRSVLSALRRNGLLLLTDAEFPSVTAIVAGEPVRGSWWSHPSGGDIFKVAEELDDDPDVLTLKLLSRKITFVHRSLYRAVLAVASAQEPWQLAGCSVAARALFRKVQRQGRVETTGPEARVLEERLLVHGMQVHTERGSHARMVESWTEWASHARPGRRMNPDAAKRELEERVALLNAQTGAKATVPWP